MQQPVGQTWNGGPGTIGPPAGDGPGYCKYEVYLYYLDWVVRKIFRHFCQITFLVVIFIVAHRALM